MSRERQTLTSKDVATLRVRSEGSVLPAGSVPPKASLPDGGSEVTIDGLDESGLVRVIYPDGFIRHHEAKTIEELVPKVTAFLRGRFGAGEVTFVSVPRSIKAGQSFVIKGV